MSLIPTFSARGAPSCLQPSYFTSAVFTSSAREDVVTLLSEFGSVFYLSSQPFTTFKELWIRQGWHFAHTFIIEAPTRDTYINTMFRLFAEHIADTQSVPNVVGALFGIYLFYSSQMHSKDKLHAVPRIPIPINELQHWVSLPERLDIPDIFRPYLIYILRSLLESDSFHVLPHSSTRPHNPVALPHSILVDDPKAAIPAGTSKPKGKVGRPTKRQKLEQHIDNWTTLEAKVSVSPQTILESDKLDIYLEKKSAVIDMIPKDMEKDAERDVVAALEKIAIGKEGKDGLKRLKEVVKDGNVLRTWNPVPEAAAPTPALEGAKHDEANETTSSAGIE